MGRQGGGGQPDLPFVGKSGSSDLIRPGERRMERCCRTGKKEEKKRDRLREETHSRSKAGESKKGKKRRKTRAAKERSRIRENLMGGINEKCWDSDVAAKLIWLKIKNSFSLQ